MRISDDAAWCAGSEELQRGFQTIEDDLDHLTRLARFNAVARGWNETAAGWSISIAGASCREMASAKMFIRARRGSAPLGSYFQRQSLSRILCAFLKQIITWLLLEIATPSPLSPEGVLMLPAARSPNLFSHSAAISLIGTCGFARVRLFGEADYDGVTAAL